jgi:hypothetical protein
LAAEVHFTFSPADLKVKEYTLADAYVKDEYFGGYYRIDAHPVFGETKQRVFFGPGMSTPPDKAFQIANGLQNKFGDGTVVYVYPDESNPSPLNEIGQIDEAVDKYKELVDSSLNGAATAELLDGNLPPSSISPNLRNLSNAIGKAAKDDTPTLIFPYSKSSSHVSEFSHNEALLATAKLLQLGPGDRVPTFSELSPENQRQVVELVAEENRNLTIAYIAPSNPFMQIATQDVLPNSVTFVGEKDPFRLLGYGALSMSPPDRKKLSASGLGVVIIPELGHDFSPLFNSPEAQKTLAQLGFSFPGYPKR